jgi:hypothetical protein
MDAVRFSVVTLQQRKRPPCQAIRLGALNSEQGPFNVDNTQLSQLCHGLDQRLVFLSMLS